MVVAHRSLVLVASVVALVGCRDSRPAPAEPPKVVCPAESLGVLDRNWQMRPDCTADNVACRDACLANDPAACMSRAMILERDVATKDEATMLFVHACELGLVAGCTNYAGFLWANNRGNAAADCALAIFEKTCAVKDPFGCGMVGRMIVDDAKTADDVARGKGRLDHSCEELGGFPCRVLALEVEAGKFGPFDPARIASLLGLACQRGDRAACGVHATASETFK